jgi:CheY-like chemotaxis protein
VSFQVSRFAGRTVLVVEDDPDSRAMMAQMLGALGARVVLAESASAALGALAHETPDLILCDLRLAERDDVGLIRRVREEPRLTGPTETSPTTTSTVPEPWSVSLPLPLPSCPSSVSLAVGTLSGPSTGSTNSDRFA